MQPETGAQSIPVLGELQTHRGQNSDLSALKRRVSSESFGNDFGEREFPAESRHCFIHQHVVALQAP